MKRVVDVAVVIPMYNAQESIVHCLESVRLGTVMPKEVIVVDDASIDRSVIRVKEYKKTYPQFPLQLYQLKKNSGQSIARNLAIDHSTALWVAFLDADDYWTKDKLEVEIKILLEHTSIALLGARSIGNPDRRLIKITSKKMLYKHYFLCSSVIVHRKALGNKRFDENLRYGEDTKLWFSIIENYPGAIISDQLYYPIDGSFTDIPRRGHLSSNLWKMEKSELSLFIFLYKNKKISFPSFFCAFSFSLMKYIYRYVRCKLIKKS